jgi:hypothetical protein
VGRPARLPDRTTAVNSGRRRRRACAGNTSGGELLATLATATGDDRAARTGAHAQPEAVGLGPPAVVRLERALAHEGLPLRRRCTPTGGRARRAGADFAAPPTRKLVSVDRPHRSAADRPVVRSEGGRDRPQTGSSIAEVRRRPVAGSRSGSWPTVHGRARVAGRPAGTPCDGPATRPGSRRCRCPAVDGAVSVAVAPRRTPGIRRAGRPRRSTDRRAPVVPSGTGP